MIEQPMENRKWFQKRDLLLILLVGAARNREGARSCHKRTGSFTASA